MRARNKLRLFEVMHPYRGEAGRRSRFSRADLDDPLVPRVRERLLDSYVRQLVKDHWDKKADPPRDGVYICLKRAGRDGKLPGFREYCAENWDNALRGQI